MLKKIVNFLLPKLSWRRKFVVKVLIKLKLKSPVIAGFYNTWFQQQWATPQFREELIDVSKGPLISIIVPAYNTPARYLNDLVYSIVSQAYENWELILVNASTNLKDENRVARCAEIDRRIKVIKVKNKGISANTNKGITASSGEYVAFCDHDDILDPFALYEVAKAIIRGGADLIYSDEDKVSDDGEIYFDPHYKPDWSPDLLNHVNYINHLTVVNKKLVEKAGKLNPQRDGAQDYDLLLRIVDLGPKIVHIPKVLYHWRAAQNSTAQDFSSKKNITDAASKSLTEHFQRNNINVDVVPEQNRPGFYDIQFNKQKNVSILILPFLSDASLRLFLEILVKRTATNNNTQYTVITPTGTEPRFKTKNVTVRTIDISEGYMALALAAVKTKELIVVGGVALPERKDWAVDLLGFLEQPQVAAVSPIIISSDSTVEDCGLVKSHYGYIPLFEGSAAFNNQTYFGNTSWVRNVDALSGKVVAVRKKQLEEFNKTHTGDIHDLLFKFSKTVTNRKVINTKVIFNNQSIKLRPFNNDLEFFNSNLYVQNGEYLPYTPELAAVDVLSRVAEQEGVSL